MNRKFLTLSSLLLASLALGCGGPDTGEVKGKVTLDGNPVTAGDLSFTTEDGAHTAAAEIQSDGSFEVQGGLRQGSHIVEYSPPFAETPDDEGWEQAKNYRNCTVPEDYRAKIESGENAVEITLVPKKRQ